MTPDEVEVSMRVRTKHQLLGSNLLASNLALANRRPNVLGTVLSKVPLNNNAWLVRHNESLKLAVYDCGELDLADEQAKSPLKKSGVNP